MSGYLYFTLKIRQITERSRRKARRVPDGHRHAFIVRIISRKSRERPKYGYPRFYVPSVRGAHTVQLSFLFGIVRSR